MTADTIFLGYASEPATSSGVGTPVSYRDMALSYVERGWPVLPCKPGSKEPLGRIVHHGAHDACCDPGWVRWVWERYPDANVGLATGRAFDVVDVDDYRFAGVYLALMPIAPVVRTSRGYHFYVQVTGSTSLSMLMPGADLKGLGGYVIAPPSVHESGTRYWWVRDPARYEVAPVPESLSKAVLRRRRDVSTETTGGVVGRAAGASDPFAFEQPSLRPTGPKRDYGAVALNADCAKVRAATVNTRNETLNRAAFKLGQLVGAGELDSAVVVSELLSAAMSCGLEAAEAVGTIRSGMRTGAGQPRARR
jgi:hypothetical protein